MTALAPLVPPLLVLALLALRQPLVVILLAIAASVHLLWGAGRLEYIAEDLWIALDKELVLSIPMFMLCGQVMTRGGTARRIVAVMRALTPSLPGGMAVACTLACALDASISGSSIVTMLAIGSVMVPSLLAAGYERRYALGAVMAGGTLGIIIPPSIPMIIYGLVTETSVVELFRAGIGPGLLLTLAFAAYAVWRHRHLPPQRFDLRALLAALREGSWALAMPAILLGGIYSGRFGLIEAAAVALVYAVAIELFVHRDLTLRGLYDTVLEAARFGGALFPIFAIAVSLSVVLAEHRVPEQLVGLVQGRGLRLRQGAVRHRDDPEPRDRLSHAAGRHEPDCRHGRVQAAVRRAVPGGTAVHRHHARHARRRHLAAVDRAGAGALAVQVAGRPAAGCDLAQCRRLGRAARHRLRTARVEVAARRRRQR